MPKRLLILFSFLFFQPFVGKGQECSIQLDFQNASNQKVYLAYYFNGNILINDSTVIDNSGYGFFQNENKLQQGIYQLYFNKEKQVDFLLGESQKITITEDFDGIKMKGATETLKFNDYLQYLENKKVEQKRYQQAKKDYQAFEDSVEKYNQLLHHLDQEITNYWLNEAKNYPHTFYGKFLKSNYIATPDSIPQKYTENDSLKWVYEYNFMQNHYWDYFDLSDTRMWHTPTIKGRLNNYFNKILLQQSDTVLKQANQLIDAVKDNSTAFQNLVSFLLNNSFQSEMMGIENVFVAIAENYYLTGKADWVSDKTLDKIKLEVFYRKNNLLGKKARELVLEDIDGEYYSLHQITTPYTLLVFWEPNCGHCKTEIPKLYEELFLKADPSQLTIYTVYTQDQPEKWQKFINDHQLTDWINVWDPQHTSQFPVLYNVRSTPSIYLLDKEKTIIAKNMSVENAKLILENRSVSFEN